MRLWHHVGTGTHALLSCIALTISVVKCLAKDTDTMVIATIHQPNYEVFSLFDYLLLLAGGRTMYNGLAGEFISI